MGFEPTAFLHLGAGALTEACTYATAYGMTDQVDTINQAFSPSDHEIAKAHKMLDCSHRRAARRLISAALPAHPEGERTRQSYGLWGKTEGDTQRTNV